MSFNPNKISDDNNTEQQDKLKTERNVENVI